MEDGGVDRRSSSHGSLEGALLLLVEAVHRRHSGRKDASPLQVMGSDLKGLLVAEDAVLWKIGHGRSVTRQSELSWIESPRSRLGLLLYEDLLKAAHHQQPVERPEEAPSGIVQCTSNEVVLHSIEVLHRVAADVGVDEAQVQLLERQCFRFRLSRWPSEEGSEEARNGRRLPWHVGNGNGPLPQGRKGKLMPSKEEQSEIMSETGEIVGLIPRAADAGVHHRQQIVVFEQDEEWVLRHDFIAGKGRLWGRDGVRKFKRKCR